MARSRIGKLGGKGGSLRARVTNRGYQTGTTAAPQQARRVIATPPAVQVVGGGTVAAPGNQPKPKAVGAGIPIHNRYGRN